MVQVVSHQPLTVEAQVSPRKMYGGRSGTRTGFSPSSLGLPCQYNSMLLPILL
jgi:hypothetical protein